MAQYQSSHLISCAPQIQVKEDSRGFPWWYSVNILCFHCREYGFHPCSGKFHRPRDAVGGKKRLYNDLSALKSNCDILLSSHCHCSLSKVMFLGRGLLLVWKRAYALWVCHKGGAESDDTSNEARGSRRFCSTWDIFPRNKVLVRFYYMWIFPRECIYLALCFILKHK